MVPAGAAVTESITPRTSCRRSVLADPVHGVNAPRGSLRADIVPTAQRGFHYAISALEERNLVDVSGEKPMPQIERSVAVVTTPVVCIHRSSAIVGVTGDIQGVRPCVAQIKLKTMGQALVVRNRQVMIVGYQIVRDGTDLSKQLIRTARIDRAGSRR